MKQTKHKSQFILTGILLLFILSKIPDLSLPYFWDELGVYARAALYLNDHHAGLLPSALPPELSRGHPLLFDFIFGVVFKIFGDGVLTGHLLALFISVCFLVCVYIITKKYFNLNAAYMAVIFLAIQPVFFAQSSMVLPEILLALFCLISVYFWIEKKYLLFAVFSVCAILTKETAVILPVVIICGNLAQVFTTKQKIKIRLIHFIVFIPWVVFVIFLFIQKQQNGWYLFPLHENNLQLNPQRFFEFITHYCSFVFIAQGRFISTILIIIFIALAIIRKMNLNLKPVLIYLLFLITGGLLFSAFNFYMDRYMLFVVAAFSVFIGWVFSQTDFLPVSRFLMIGIVAAPFIFTTSGFDYDVSANYKKYIDIQSAAVAYAIENLGSTDSLFANFPATYCFRDSRFGYCDTTDIRFSLVRKSEISSANYFLISNPGAFDHQMPPQEELDVIKKFSNEVGSVVLLRLNSK